MIDDELLLLNSQKAVIETVEGFELVGVYTSASKISQEIREKKPEVVFLDIELGGMSGIEVADKISEQFPALDIVFITAYSEYAVEAFEVNAIDYLLKPLTTERLLKTYGRLKDTKREAIPVQATAKIKTFSSLQFFGATENAIPVKWRTSKAKELFTLLMHYNEKPVTKDFIINLLWPEGIGKNTFSQLYTTVYQVRSMLRLININIQISSKEECYILHLNDVRLDVEEWLRKMESFVEVTKDNLQSYQEAMNLYQGDYLEDCPYSWAEAERERLRLMWCMHMRKIADFFIEKERYNEAIETMEKIQQHYPYMEDSYFMLMKLYAVGSDRYQVENQYMKLTSMLADQLGISPELEVQDWYNSWKGSKV